MEDLGEVVYREGLLDCLRIKMDQEMKLQAAWFEHLCFQQMGRIIWNQR